MVSYEDNVNYDKSKSKTSDDYYDTDLKIRVDFKNC